MHHKWITLFVGLFAIATAPPASRAEDLPADPERVLRAAGLILKENSYIFEAEAEAEPIQQKIRRIRTRLSQKMIKFEGLMETYLSGKKAAAQLYYSQDLSFDNTEARKSADEAESKRIEAMALVEPMVADQMELRREEARHRNLVDPLPRQYTALAADPRIQAALRALNKRRHPKLALGPFAAYQQNVLKQANQLLDILGFRREGDMYWFAEESDLIKQVGLAYRQWRELAKDEPRLARPGQAASAPGMTRPVALRPVPARPPVAVAPPTKEAGPTTAPARIPPTAAELAAKRAVLDRLVSELRTQADALQKRREVLLVEGEARDALDVIYRINGKSHKARLGSNPRLEQVLKNLEDMERAVQTMKMPPTLHNIFPKEDDRRNEEPASLVVDKVADHPRAAHDISKLPKYKVLQIRDGNSLSVRKPGEGPVLVRLLLGVAPLRPPADSASSRRKKLEELLNKQEVALADDPERAPNGGRIAAWVYRVSDGLLVNLAMVKEGYGVTADDAPAPLKRTLSAAEQEAMVEQRGLWSPAVRDEAAALGEEEARRREAPTKGGPKRTRKKNRHAQNQNRVVQEGIGLMDEQTPMPDIATWVMRQEQTVHTEQVKFELHEAAERAKRDEARRNPPSVPELDPGPAAGAFALLVCGMLILADRRRANSARRSPTGGVSG